MDAHEFLATLASAVSDPQAREKFLVDPRAVFVTDGLELPDWFRITATEGDAPELTITLPPLIDATGEMSDEQLAGVTGGWVTGTEHNGYQVYWGAPRF
jgi:hypothetical protein